MYRIKYCLISSLFLLLLICRQSLAQNAIPLVRSNPEAEGVFSDSILHFLDAAAKSKTEFHSFMLLRHGKVIAEGWWNPYLPDLRHTLYSCSKSFTATAVGLAISEKRLSLNDKVISFFPKDLPDTVSAYLAELTVKDMLMMSDGQEPDPTGAVAGKSADWIRGFLATPIKHEPGTQFLYNSLGTYMLSAIVQKLTGQKTVDYLKTRLFDPLGISGMDWETDLKGINTGGWGLRLKTEDMARFAELFLQKGNWNGTQVLPASWVEEASSTKIMQDPNAPQSRKDSSDWLQGYCFQMWRCRHNAYRGDGAFGQFMIVMPDQDAVMAITAETPSMQEEINLVWTYILPAFQKGSLPPNPAATNRLKAKIKTLALPVPAKQDEILEKKIMGKTYTAAPNPAHLQQIGFRFSKGICQLSLQTDTGTNFQIGFGAGKWQPGETNMPGPSLVAATFENTGMLYPAKVAGSYTWKDSTTLELVLRYIESPHTAYYTCHFQGNEVFIETSRSFDQRRNKVSVKAEVK